MTDLVERLRGYARNCGDPPEDYLTWQAANEVERLRDYCNQSDRETLRLDAEIERLRGELHSVHAHLNHMRDETERLRTLKTPASQELLDITKGCLDDAEAEAGRLRARLDNWVDVNAEAGREIERLQGIADARAAAIVAHCTEIERLRAELGQVREILNDREAEIARLRAENNRLRSMLWPKRTN